MVPEDSRQVEYLGFREPVEDFLARGLNHARARLPEYDPGSLAAARIGIVADDDEDLDLLGLLEGSMAEVQTDRADRERP